MGLRLVSRAWKNSKPLDYPKILFSLRFNCDAAKNEARHHHPHTVSVDGGFAMWLTNK